MTICLICAVKFEMTIPISFLANLQGVAVQVFKRTIFSIVVNSIDCLQSSSIKQVS